MSQDETNIEGVDVVLPDGRNDEDHQQQPQEPQDEENNITIHDLVQEINTLKATNERLTNELDIEKERQIQLLADLENEKEKLLVLEERVLRVSGDNRSDIAQQLSGDGDENDNAQVMASKSPSIRSLSCFFRLLFVALFIAISNVLSSLSLLLSVVLSGYYIYVNNEIINKSVITVLIGQFINFVGAVIFMFAVVQQSYSLFRLAGVVLAVGHAVEVGVTLIKMIRLRKKVLPILLAISSPTLAVGGYALLSGLYGLLLLIIHSLAEYIKLFRSPVETSLGNQSANDNENQSFSQPDLAPKPEQLPDDMLDTFAFMMSSNDVKVWNFGFLIFFIQAGLSIMILAEQAVFIETKVLFGVPTITSFYVSFSQFWALLLAIFWKNDILTSIQMLSILWYGRNGNWPHDKIGVKDGTFTTWFDKVLLPNLLRLIAGILVLATSFLIIVKSGNVLDLFKDFTALILISEIDNAGFRLCNHGYFGKKLKNETEKIKEICVVDDSKAKVLCLPLRLFMLLIVFGAMLGGWSYFVHEQYSGKFHLKSFGVPNCNVEYPFWIGDGRCDGRDYNTEECGYDGGDCIQFNKDYPNCHVNLPYWIGDGLCVGGRYNTEYCGYDGGDCIQFNKDYPNCDVDFPSVIGNGHCAGGDYNTEECGYDGGDCIMEDYPNCHVEYPFFIGNGRCNGGDYNTEECGYDGGDCN